MNKSFNELNLNSNIVEGLKLQGITSPTEVQELTIPKALENIDIIAESHTGSGKIFMSNIPKDKYRKKRNASYNISSNS